LRWSEIKIVVALKTVFLYSSDMSSEQEKGNSLAEIKTPEKPKEQMPSVLHRITTHPLFTFTGWLCAVVGLVAFFLTLEKRELSFAVNPVRTAVVQSGQSSQIKVSYLGKEISGDITACQIALWNAGKRPIKKDDILEPVIITLTNAQILEATIRHLSRNVTGIALDLNHIQDGRIGINWNILEKGDGCDIQLIYAGSRSQTIEIFGIVEGQKEIKQYRPELEDYKPTLKQPFWLNMVTGAAIGGVAAFTFVLADALADKSKGKPFNFKKVAFWFFIMVAIMVVVAFLMVVATKEGNPPFGF
jgi:hypothetical protein